jgi:hypothetical protein
MTRARRSSGGGSRPTIASRNRSSIITGRKLTKEIDATQPPVKVAYDIISTLIAEGL